MKILLAATLALLAAPAARAEPSPIVELGALLADLKPADRLGFIGEITLINGEIVSLRTARLKGVSAARSAEILKALNGAPRAKPGKRPKGAKPVTLDAILAGVPADAKRDFVESLSFINGEVVSARTGALEKAVGAKRTREILVKIGVSEEIKGPDGKSLCGDGWCDHSACTSSSSDPRPQCLSHPSWTCRSTCR